MRRPISELASTDLRHRRRRLEVRARAVGTGQAKQLMRYGAEWVTTDNSKVPDDYKAWLANVARIFATPASIASASKEDISTGLMSLHAFMEQSRFVKGGEKNLAATFWAANDQDLRKVKTTLTLLIHGSGDFIKRLHDVIYDPRISLGRFKKFCALELYGTMRPDNSPPINSRMLKALRFPRLQSTQPSDTTAPDAPSPIRPIST